MNIDVANTGVIREFRGITKNNEGLSVAGKSIKFEIDNSDGDRPITFGIIPRLANDAAYPTGDNDPEILKEDLEAGRAINLNPGTLTMPKKEVGDPTKTCKVTDLGTKGIGLAGFRQLLALGAACELTYGKVREVLAAGATPTGQVEEPFYEVVSGELQSVRELVNVTVLKGQEFDKDYVLGPFAFKPNFVVGANMRGLEYTVQPGARVIVEIWYVNLFTMADFVGKYVEALSRNRA